MVSEYAPQLLPQRDAHRVGCNVAVLGSYEDWEVEIVPTRNRLRAAGFHVLTPLGDTIMSTSDANTIDMTDADAAAVELMQEQLGAQLHAKQVGQLLVVLSHLAIEASDFAYFAGKPKPSARDGWRVAVDLRVALNRGPVYGTPFSPNLEERQDIIVNFPGYMRHVVPATPEQLLVRYEAEHKL